VVVIRLVGDIGVHCWRNLPREPDAANENGRLRALLSHSFARKRRMNGARCFCGCSSRVHCRRNLLKASHDAPHEQGPKSNRRSLGCGRDDSVWVGKRLSLWGGSLRSGRDYSAWVAWGWLLTLALLFFEDGGAFFVA
jgi:hypothetical protein